MPRELTFEEAFAWARSLRRYDYRGRPILSRAEWERLGRLRRFRDWLAGWDPPPDDQVGYYPPPLDAPD